MEWSAAIIAEQQTAYDKIAARLEQAGMTRDHYHCPDIRTLDELLQQSRIDIIFRDLTSATGLPRQGIAELLSLAGRRTCPVCFVSDSGGQELVTGGLIPANSAVIDPAADDDLLCARLSDLMAGHRTAAGEPQAPGGFPSEQSPVVCDRFTFGKLLSQESARSRLTGRPFAMLLIKPSGSDRDVVPGSHEPFWQEVARSIHLEIRGSDLMCHLRGIGFVLLLPETSADMTEGLAERIRSRVTSLPGYPGIRFEISPVTETLTRQLLEPGSCPSPAPAIS